MMFPAATIVPHAPAPSVVPHVDRYAIHMICKSHGIGLKGLTAIDGVTGEFISEAWHVTNGDPDDLIGGWLYFHDSSNNRSTFAARIVEVILLTSTGGKHRVAFRIRRVQISDVGWRGAKPSRSVHNGGMVPARLPHEVIGM